MGGRDQILEADYWIVELLASDMVSVRTLIML